MTIVEAARMLLTDFSPEERSIPDSVTYPGRNAAVQAAMNSALQELFGEGSPWIRYDEKGAITNAPTAVTIAVTNGSDAATITGWADWMAGCTLQIEGSTVDNQIRNASASAVLKYPYDGTTGTKAATVYHNSVTIPDTIMRVMDPVCFNHRKLSPVVSSHVPIFSRIGEDFGFDSRFQNLPLPDRINETQGTPIAYCVDTWSPSATSQPSARLRIIPASGVAGIIDYRAMLAPPTITDITSTSTLPIPQQFMQSIFHPIARKHLSGCAFFRTVNSMQEIDRAYQEARRMLAKLDPGANQGRVMRSVY